MATSEPDPERYVTPDELRAELPFTDDDFPVQTEQQFTNALQRALDSASDLVEQWGDTKYQPTETTQRVGRPPHAPEEELPLPLRPVQSVASVAIDGDTLPTDAYRARKTYLTLTLTGTERVEWPTEAFSVEVTWTYGYESVPGPVFDAIIRLARNRLDQIETDGYEGDDEGGFRPPEAIKRECAAMVNGYSAPSYFGGATAI